MFKFLLVNTKYQVVEIAQNKLDFKESPSSLTWNSWGSSSLLCIGKKKRASALASNSAKQLGILLDGDLNWGDKLVKIVGKLKNVPVFIAKGVLCASHLFKLQEHSTSKNVYYCWLESQNPTQSFFWVVFATCLECKCSSSLLLI